MKIIKNSCWVLLFVILVGCSVNPAPPISGNTPTSPTSSVVPQATATLPRPTVSVSPTSQGYKFNVQTHCPAGQLGVRELSTLPGTLVFSAYNRLAGEDVLVPEPGKEPTISFWRPQSGQISTYSLGVSEGDYYVESPEKDKLAFTGGKMMALSKDLTVLDAQGVELGKVVVPDNWTFTYWWNDEQILLQQFVAKTKFNLAVVDLSDKERQSVSTNFPDMDKDSEVLYNPQGTMVWYRLSTSSDPDLFYSVIWDVKESKEIARIVNASWASWAPDGNRLMMVTNVDNRGYLNRVDIHLINTAGEESRATYFGETYDMVELDQPVWSPNSRYIAFWLITEFPIKAAKLGVLDTETLTVDLFCKEFNPRPYANFLDYKFGDQMFLVYGTNPIWSPDSRYLLIKDDIGNEIRSTYLFDLQEDTMTQIAMMASPVGWLK